MVNDQTVGWIQNETFVQSWSEVLCHAELQQAMR